jgi:predicted secreted protein
MHWIVLGGAFCIFWFLALQIVLPIGNRTAGEIGLRPTPGTDPSAPVNPHLVQKLVITTLCASAMWGVLYALILVRVIDL